MSFSEGYLLDKGIKTVLHVGADRGGELPQYHRMGVEKVVWIEANPEVYQELLDNLKIMNIQEVESLPFNALITNQDDVETDFNLYYGPDAGYLVGNKGMSSILKGVPSWWGSKYHRGTIQLKSVTLDTFLKRNHLGFDFDMLNMDTQGAELLICMGALDLLRNVKYINSEVTLHSPAYEGNPLKDTLDIYFTAFGFRHVSTELCGDGSWGDALYERY